MSQPEVWQGVRILSPFPLNGGKEKANSKAFNFEAPELQL
jgi:hypothetical protein